jgi:quaternary ammonium compound-resistance protein SugE
LQPQAAGYTILWHVEHLPVPTRRDGIPNRLLVAAQARGADCALDLSRIARYKGGSFRLTGAIGWTPHEVRFMNPTIGWFLLLMACLFEVIWAVSMKYSIGFTRPGPTAITWGAAIISFFLMAQAARPLSIGTCYGVLNGVGVASVVILGILLFRESAHPLRLLFVTFILIGIVGLRVMDPVQGAAAPAPVNVPLGTEVQMDEDP